MYYFLQTIPGLGPLAWHEAVGLLAKGKNVAHLTPPDRAIRFVPGRNDIVFIETGQSGKDLLKLRITEDLFAVAVRGFKIAPDTQGLRQIHASVRNSRLVGDALNAWSKATGNKRPASTFRVVVREIGKHEFRRRDIEKAVADAVTAGWPGKWREVAEDAEIEGWTTLFENELLCGVRLSDAKMRQQRGPKTSDAPSKWQHLPAALRPALAAAMIQLTQPSPDDLFLDPMAGSGTLLVERAMAGPFGRLFGGDINGPAFTALQANTEGIKGDVSCERWDARMLPLPAQSISKIAVNLPFGKQVGAGEDLPKLYQAILKDLERVLQPGGLLVALISDQKTLEIARAKAASKLRAGPNYRVQVLGQPAFICTLSKAV